MKIGQRYLNPINSWQATYISEKYSTQKAEWSFNMVIADQIRNALVNRHFACFWC